MPATTVNCLPILTVQWLPVPARVLAEATYAVIRLRLSTREHLLADWRALLQPHEQQRAARFQQRADERRFIFGRGLFRLIAGSLTGQSPPLVTIETTPSGKPILPQTPDWHLNIAHAGEWVIVGVGQQPVGVDVEYINPQFAFDELVPSIFSKAEQQALADSTDPRRLFYELWTRKEALVKATGQGMDEGFVHIPAFGGTYINNSTRLTTNTFWQVQPFFVDDAYPAALAFVYRNRTTLIQFYDMDPGQLTNWLGTV